MSRLKEIIGKPELSGDDLDFLFTMDVPEYKEYSRRTSRLNSELNRLDELSKALKKSSPRHNSQ